MQDDSELSKPQLKKETSIWLSDPTTSQMTTCPSLWTVSTKFLRKILVLMLNWRRWLEAVQIWHRFRSRIWRISYNDMNSQQHDPFFESIIFYVSRDPSLTPIDSFVGSISFLSILPMMLSATFMKIWITYAYYRIDVLTILCWAFHKRQSIPLSKFIAFFKCYDSPWLRSLVTWHPDLTYFRRAQLSLYR